MSVKRRDLIKYLMENGFFLKREGRRHSYYSNGKGVNVAVKRHNLFDRIAANEVCKDAGLQKNF